jgi:glycosyltransferase involved in cell wall biosynthesis
MPMHKSIETKNNIVVRLGVNKLDGKMNPWHESDKIRILTCSRAVKLKQLDLLAKVLINNDFNKPIEWVHIGDGPVLDEIKQICSLPKQNLTCTFLGAMSNDMVHQYFTENSVDWFINVSQYEGLPVSIMESMAYGIPTIATAVGATDEIVNESNGFILPDKISEEILIHALHQAFEMSADTYKCYRNQAYKTWADNFNKDKNYSDMFVKIGVEK